MRSVAIVLILTIFAVTESHSADSSITAAETYHSSGNKWYTGDERCPPPRDDGRYSPPYRPQDNPRDYPTFFGADKPGWSCSYQRDDSVMVQYGDSRTSQEQWLGMYGGTDN